LTSAEDGKKNHQTRVAPLTDSFGSRSRLVLDAHDYLRYKEDQHLQAKGHGAPYIIILFYTYSHVYTNIT
jgi:hypothetical protein